MNGLAKTLSSFVAFKALTYSLADSCGCMAGLKFLGSLCMSRELSLT